MLNQEEKKEYMKNWRKNNLRDMVVQYNKYVEKKNAGLKVKRTITKKEISKYQVEVNKMIMIGLRLCGHRDYIETMILLALKNSAQRKLVFTLTDRELFSIHQEHLKEDISEIYDHLGAFRNNIAIISYEAINFHTRSFDNFIKLFSKVVNHEFIHGILHNIESKEASHKFDNINHKVGI